MKSFRRLVYPYLIWAGLLIVLPMLIIVFYAFSTMGNTLIPVKLTLQNFVRFFSDPIFIEVLWRSVKLAFITTLICIALGYPAAYIIAKLKPNSQELMVLLVTLPQLINMLVRTIIKCSYICCCQGICRYGL